jgi:2-polyprenyl-6-methoxyphenol hydroxylase-like FAD-dependent oxidoreductase
MDADYDVVVVGARIAGSILGALLGGRGLRVLVLDRSSFPSDTLSTHFFRWPTFAALDRIGVLNAVYASAPKLSTNYNFVDGHVFTEDVKSPDGPSHHMCVRRLILDDLLVQRVRTEHTVTLRERAAVTDLLIEGGTVIGVQWSEEGKRFQASSRAVIGADGIHSVVSRQVNVEVEQAEPVRRAMFYAYFRDFEAQLAASAEFHYLGNHLAYVFPTDSGMTLLAVSLPIDEFPAFKRDPEGNFVSFLGSMPEIKPRLEKASREGPVRGTASIPGYQRKPFGKGWALVGDSAQVMDPWSGQGIDQASTHAGYLADSLIEWHSGSASWEESMHQYWEKRNRFSTSTYDRTCKFAKDFRPMTQAALKRRGLS